MDKLADREKKDAEINKALELANNILKKTQIDEKGDDEEENLDQLIDMVRSIDVESAIRKEKLVDLDSRTEFAAQLEEIESKIGNEDVSRLEADIHVDARVPAEGRERLLRARCRVLQEEVSRLQKQASAAQEKFHRAKKAEQEKTDALARSDKNAEKTRKELDKLKQSYANETTKREEAEKKVSQLKRENDDLKRANKIDKNKKQNDVRLQRALEEVQRYKTEMAELVRKNRDQGTVTRHQFDELSKESSKQKRLSSEYKSVIQKQSKLIEILRNKATHLEAARVLEFSEDEFLRALDWQSK